LRSTFDVHRSTPYHAIVALFTLGNSGRKRLIQRWGALMHTLEAPQELRFGLLDDLLRRYGEPHRSYHTLFHIEWLFNALEPHPVAEQAALDLAVWFHDAVYNTTRDTNEEESAELALRALEPLDPQLARRVGGMVLATKTHRSDDPTTRLLLDADLSILGSEGAVYRRYSKAIRQEYAWVPPEAYRAGRLKVLRSFLARPRIYVTPAFGGLEEAARANLQSEVEWLEQAKPGSLSPH
jgi:predicted metal-dependent HD superfamily phosphohydrolase